jgi:CubicO group peptidase (beta-lactamase class C family)
MRKQIWAVLLLAVTMPRLSAAAEAPAPANLDATLAPIIARHKIPGMAALVLRGDQIAAAGVAGVRKAGSPERITLEDKFHLGSDTKAMTATLLGLLVDEGKVQWTTTLGELFGDSIKDLHPDWKNVTLQQVLAHRAGLPRDVGVLKRAALARSQKTLPEQRLEALISVLSQKPESTPGEKYSYANVGYILLGAVVEKIGGRPWEALMQERLFRPLGIVSGGFGPPSASGTLQQPWGHDAKGKPAAADMDNPAFCGPAGTAHMTISDWSKFISLHLRGDHANPHAEAKLLKASTFAALHTPSPGEEYMGGWIVTKRPWSKGPRAEDVGRALTHSGSNTVWFCTVWLAPEIDLAVLVVCNQGGDEATRACDDAAGALIGKFLRVR